MSYPRLLRTLSAASIAVSLVALAPHAAAVGEEVSAVAGPCDGSSQPTLYANNHRLALTEGGRTLALFDPHGSGQQLVWRDGAGPWQPGERGPGTPWFLEGEERNDRPASIALARDPGGVEHAWIVLSGYGFSRPSPVVLRRLSDLDAPAGPTVGPPVVVEPAGRGNARADLAFEGGSGVITWLQRTGDSSYELVAEWFADLDVDEPASGGHTVLHAGTSSAVAPTAVSTPWGVRVLARTDKLRVYGHDSGAPPGEWTAGAAGVRAPGKIRPSAVALGDGILAAFESNLSKNIVKVVSVAADGGDYSLSLNTGEGYSAPALATDGHDAWVVMIGHGAERTVVSRRLAGAGGWGPDRVELGAAVEGGGDYASPNTLREASGDLEFIVDGARCPTTSQANAVVSLRRPLEP